MTGTETPAPETGRVPGEEDRWRAACYRMLSAMLHAPPDAALLAQVASLADGDGGTPLLDTFRALGRAAAAAAPDAARREHEDLFHGIGEAALSPYESWYRTGFLYEKPLARLRRDLARIGARGTGAGGEPEDHLAAIFEVMAGLAEGSFDAPAETERAFFEEHVASWADRFLEDLEGREDAPLYAALGGAGRAFLEVERRGFEQAGEEGPQSARRQ